MNFVIASGPEVIMTESPANLDWLSIVNAKSAGPVQRQNTSVKHASISILVLFRQT